MSDEDLRLRVCEWLGIDPAARVGTAGGWRQVPPLSDEGFWLPRLQDECRRRQWVVTVWPDGWCVTALDRRPITPRVRPAEDRGYPATGTDAAALARAMLAAAEAEARD